MAKNPEFLPIPPVERKPAEDSDALERSLLPPVTGDKAKDFAKTIQSTHSDALSDRSDWESRLSEWDDKYYSRMPKKDFPWAGAANFHVPLEMTGIETYKPRLIEAVLGQEPPIQVVPVESSDDARRDRVELFLNWQIRVELDIAPVVAESAHLFLLPGTVIAKTFWDVQRRKRSYVREYAAGTMLDDILHELFGDKLPIDIKSTGRMEWEGSLPVGRRAGAPADLKIKMVVLDEGDIQVRVDEEYVVERPRVELIEPPDFIIPAKCGSDIQRAPWCEQRLWVFESQLRDKARSGVFSASQVEKLLATRGPSGDLSQQDSVQYREGQSSAEGVEDQGASNVRADQWEVLERYERYDINEDGNELDIIAWYCDQLPGELLGWDLVDNVYAHGRRPFRVGRFFPIPFRFYGLAFPETIRDISAEADTMHNQRVDWGTIQNLPFYFYRASSTLATFPARLRPGDGVPLDNPKQDIEFPRWQGSPAFGQAEEALLLQYYERITGLTDLTLGRQPNRVGATRTAAGTSTLLSEAGLRQKTALESFQRFWTGIFEDVLALDQEYLPPGKEFRVTGRMPELIRLRDRNEIQGRYDIRLTTATQTMNRVVAREDATVVLQALLNPAYLQVGLVGMKGIQRALGDFLRAFGKDPDVYLELQTAPRSPEEELALVIAGQDIKPSNGEDHMMHMMVHQRQLTDPVVRSVLRPEGVTKLTRHIQETQQVQQAQQMAMALQQGGPPEAAPPAGMDSVEAGQGAAAPQPGVGGSSNLSPTPGGPFGALGG